jgi:hypothetical protein
MIVEANGAVGIADRSFAVTYRAYCQTIQKLLRLNLNLARKFTIFSGKQLLV